MTIGVICGFQAEFNCFNKALLAARLDPRLFHVLVSGSSPAQAEKAAKHLIKARCRKLISFGIAGGLDPSLSVGDVVFATHVITTLDQSYGERPSTRIEKLQMRAENRTVKGSICGVDAIAFTPAEKATLFATTRAAVADMESHALAREATENGLPFFALRAISDSATDTLPTYVAEGVNAEGKPQIMPILKGLAANPLSLPHLLRLKRNTDKALASLESASARILPSLVG